VGRNAGNAQPQCFAVTVSAHTKTQKNNFFVCLVI
jgi:hypothetical protein